MFLNTQYGLGNVPRFFPYPQYGNKTIIKLLKEAGAVMALMAQKADGQSWEQLNPRTLPNGIANSPTVQRVSGDYVIQASDIEQVATGATTNVWLAQIKLATLTGILGGGLTDTIATKLNSSNSIPLNGSTIDNVNSVGKHYINPANWMIIVPLGTTLAQAQALLTGTVIRYQLATPIDTLNVPFTNPMIDLSGKVGKNLFDVVQTPYQVLANTTYSIFGNGLTVNATSTATYRMVQFELKLIPNATAYLKALSSRTGANGGGMIVYDSANNTIVGGSSTLNQNLSFTVPSDGIIRIRFHATGGTAEIGSATFTNIILSYEDIPYEPYAKNNALLTNFAATQTDGFTLEATVNSNGQAVGYSNSLLNANLVDGDASGIADNWSSLIGVNLTSCVGGVQKFTPTAQFGQIRQTIDSTFTVGQRFYCSSDVKSTKTTVQLGVQTSQVQTVTSTPTHSGNGQYQKLSQIITIINQVTQIIPRVRDDGTSGWAEIEFTKPLLIRLDNNPLIQALETALGRQLTVAECDRIFPFVATTGTTLVSARDYIATEGLDSFGTIANNPSVDITGTENFAINWCGLTPTTLQAGYVMFKGLDSGSSAQYAVYLSGSGGMFMNLNGAESNVTGALLPNTNYDIRIVRFSGRLKCWVNEVLKYDQANVVSIITQPNLRLFARSNNVGGTTHSSFAKLLTAYLILARGTYGDLDKLDGVLDKVARDYR